MTSGMTNSKKGTLIDHLLTYEMVYYIKYITQGNETSLLCLRLLS